MRTKERLTQKPNNFELAFLKGNNHNQQDNFSHITWQQLIDLVVKPPQTQLPREEAKAVSPVIAAHDAPAKTKEAALHHDNFTLLRLDIDDTLLDLNAIANGLMNVGIDSFILHTTASHQYQGKANRYRVYIELAESLTYKEWAISETYLASLFGDADDCATRPAQIMYLPFYFDGYEYFIKSGFPLHKEHLFFERAEKYCQELEQHQRKKQQEAMIRPINKPFKEMITGNQISIITLIESAYVWEDLLTNHGYKRKGKAWLAPESKSTIAGGYLLNSSDGRTRFYSHHSTDPCATGKAIDKLDFIALRDFGGNRGTAIKNIAEVYFPAVHQHNRKEWMIAKFNEVKA